MSLHLAVDNKITVLNKNVHVSVLTYRSRKTAVTVYFINLNAKLPTAYKPKGYSCPEFGGWGWEGTLSVKYNEKKKSHLIAKNSIPPLPRRS